MLQSSRLANISMAIKYQAIRVYASSYFYAVHIYNFRSLFFSSRSIFSCAKNIPRSAKSESIFFLRVVFLFLMHAKATIVVYICAACLDLPKLLAADPKHTLTGWRAGSAHRRVLVRICCLARTGNNKTKILQYIYLNTIFFIFKKPWIRSLHFFASHCQSHTCSGRDYKIVFSSLRRFFFEGRSLHTKKCFEGEIQLLANEIRQK